MKLISWKSLDCDHTYDPYRLLDRMTVLDFQKGRTTIAVSFSDHCCSTFNPKVDFDGNTLHILPYVEGKIVERCACDCCFSIEFQIDGLPQGGYDVYFRGKRIQRSSEPYPVFQPTNDVYDGQMINRKNKYGFHEGTWISFYEDGKTKVIIEYPENQPYKEEDYLWQKTFYPSGRLSHYHGGDTIQSWFEDGELRSEWIDYKRGDTTFYYKFKRFENGKTETKSLEKSYPMILKSEFNSEYRGKGWSFVVIYKEEYHENGMRAFLYTKDTIFSWHENGVIKMKSYGDQAFYYNQNGSVTERTFHWKSKNLGSRADLNHAMFVKYGTGYVSEVHYVRDEPERDGTNIGIHYYWKWNDTMKLTESPKRWNGELPWKKFKEIKIESH